jgi:hypothetical protein
MPLNNIFSGAPFSLILLGKISENGAPEKSLSPLNAAKDFSHNPGIKTPRKHRKCRVRFVILVDEFIFGIKQSLIL